VRESAKERSEFWGELLSCGYCFGHWVAFALIAIYQIKLFEAWWLLDYFLTAIFIAWLSAFQWILMCWIFDRTGK
jgi:hypothetical protein